MARKPKTKKELREALVKALELLWYTDNNYSMQAKVKQFFSEVKYNFYEREKW